MTSTRRRGYRGPALHRLVGPDNRVYPWSSAYDAPGAWKCSCKTTGDGQHAAYEHLATKAAAAFKRLDDTHAFVTAATSAGHSDAFTLLMRSRRWYANPQLRRHMAAYYDHWGCLAASLDWNAVAAAIDNGSITAEHDHDLLVLRVAVSIAGAAVTLRLADLWRLPDGETRAVREALTKLLVLDGDPE